MSKFIPSDEQAAIINADANADVLVVAGAGSGKTFTMTQRIIALIGRGTPPERILGLTFTNKAAGELLERVSAAVVKQQGADDSSQGSRVSDRVFLKPSVFTYDAFFQSLVRQYGLLVGFDQNTQPISDAGAYALMSEVIERHMDEVSDGSLGNFDTLIKSVKQLSDAIGSAMIGGNCDSVDEAIRRVRTWDKKFIDRLTTVLADEVIPQKEPKISKVKRTKKDTEDEYQAKLNAQREQAHSLTVYTCNELKSTAEQRETLLDLVEEFVQLKRERGMAEFSDFTVAAYQLVKRFPSIGKRCREQYTHVLLDEYQDTSTTQAGLLTLLFHPYNDGDDADGQTTRSAVNAVGDPFQSIYAWRGASPGAFRMFQQGFGMSEESKPFPLSVTRRNTRIVLEAANVITLPLRSEPSRETSSLMREVDVASLDPLEEASEGTIGAIAYDTRGQEIDAVVRFAKAAVARYTKGDDDKEPHVAVLFRGKKKMADYQQALEKAGLTTRAVGYSALIERPEVEDLLALLHVVADHTDAASLMRLLATPRYRVEAADLRVLAKLAESLNEEQRFQALVEAGVVPADTPKDERADIVRDYRNSVANSVFLPDVMLRSDLPKLLEERATGMSESARRSILDAARVLTEVQRVTNRPVAEVVRIAVQALNLDTDTVLAQVLRASSEPVNPTVAHMPTEAIIDQVDVYTSEIAKTGTPSLRGFLVWLDHLGDVEDEAALMPSTPVDVELMTVHQSKGLEWDAVAIVDVAVKTFPSNQGDGLKVVVDKDHAGEHESGQWIAPEYQETARTWLDNPSAVPVPMRADAEILPRFPHDAATDVDSFESFILLDDTEAIDDEAYGSLRWLAAHDDTTDDSSSLPLTQAEEYGRRLHADERRLMYVAMTRARHDLFITYAEDGELSRDSSAVKKTTSNASNFWKEVYGALHSYESAEDQEHNAIEASEETVQSTLPPEEKAELAALDGDESAPEQKVKYPLGMPLPEGFFAGEHAADYMASVVTEAWNTPLEQNDNAVELGWPADLSDGVRKKLQRAANAVKSVQTADSDAESKTKDADVNGRSLLASAQLLVNDADLMNAANSLFSASSADELDEATKQRGQHIQTSGRQSVTALQARMGGLSERDERQYWRSVVRPIPRVASPAAEDGTRFHAWAEQFLKAKTDETASVPTVDEEDTQLGTWQRRFADSPWTDRVLAWAERSVVMNVPHVGIVNGKLDAVFRGGLDPADESKRFTIVDWKTGKRPTKADESKKLAQLDAYRLLLAHEEGCSVDDIDACLYYVSESDEGKRQLNARPYSEDEILHELSEGIADLQNDND